MRALALVLGGRGEEQGAAVGRGPITARVAVGLALAAVAPVVIAVTCARARTSAATAISGRSRSEVVERHARVVVAVHALIARATSSTQAASTQPAQPENRLVVRCVSCFGGALDRAAEGPGDEAAPGEDAEAQEAEGRADADEDCAFGEV